MRRYATLIFDLDGTLVDSYDALSRAINFTREAHALPALGVESVKAMVGEGVERLLQRAFERDEVPAGAQAAFETKYDEICCDGSKILAEVEQTLDQLALRDFRMAVCTNKPTGFSRKILDHLGLARHFKAIVGPDLAGARKPDAAHVRHTLHAAGGDAKATLFIGDMPVDVSAARNSGIDVAVIATGSSSIEELRDAEPDYVLERFSDLVSLLDPDVAR